MAHSPRVHAIQRRVASLMSLRPRQMRIHLEVVEDIGVVEIRARGEEFAIHRGDEIEVGLIIDGPPEVGMVGA